MDDTTQPPVGGRIFARAGRLSDRYAPVIIGLSVFVSSAVVVDGFLGLAWTRHVVGLLACCAVCGVAAGFARYRLWPLFVVAPVAAVALLLWPATLVAACYAGMRLRGRRLALFVAGAVACYAASVVVNILIGGYRAIWASVPNSVIQLLVFVCLPLIVGLWITARRQLLAQLRDRADRLEREQVARAEAARTTERARIAREMHDILAHRVSLMVLHAGAIEVNTADERLVAEAGLIRSTGRAALTDLREVLGVLRAPAGPATTAPQPVLADLPALVEESRAAGVPVTYRPDAPASALPATVQRTAYRVVQEALTNVHKHAGPTRTAVTLRELPGRLVVTVRNDPPTTPVEPPASSGLGLTGVRERVSLLGGVCAAAPDPDGGFTVRAELPVPATAVAA